MRDKKNLKRCWSHWHDDTLTSFSCLKASGGKKKLFPSLPVNKWGRNNLLFYFPTKVTGASDLFLELLVSLRGSIFTLMVNVSPPLWLPATPLHHLVLYTQGCFSFYLFSCCSSSARCEAAGFFFDINRLVVSHLVTQWRRWDNGHFQGQHCL